MNELLDDLPVGFKYCPLSHSNDDYSEENEQAFSQDESNDFDETLTKDRVRAGDFIIEIDEITM